MKISRRTFLNSLANSSAALLFPNAFSACSKTSFINNDSNIILGGGKFADASNPELIKFVLSVVNLTLKETRLVPLDFLAHGVIIDPNNYYRLIVFEKIGSGACEIDLKNMKMVRKITTSNDKYFYGHGAFTADGKMMYSTETYLDNKKGIIAIRDAHTMRNLGEFPTYGDNPHECQLIDNGNVMVVTNAGSTIGTNIEPSVTYIDMSNQQLIERVFLTNNRLNTGHIGIAKDGSLVVASAPRDGLDKTDIGGVSIRPKGKLMKTISSPNEVVQSMTGEALSVVIHSAKNIAAVTHPDGNMVTFWSVSDRQLVSMIQLEKPRGVTLTMDEKTFVISYGVNTNIMLVDVDTLTTKTDETITLTYLSGSHIYNWSKTLAEILPLGEAV
ncbi:MAG: hypothetical protein DHS20C13_30470 [Thermodesulfobacteriota bacterium]|nr:MAG: hypothetical protein DHS20C13_30470 [Thermodesulfobacteriota bacterium]